MHKKMSTESSLHSQRFYKVKNPKKNFICALCSAPRQLKYDKNLSGKNYLQIILVSISLSWISFPLMGAKSICLIFPVWMCAELANKMLYRKNIPCPYCGFDATWYRRDVKVANKMVKDFWKKNHPELGVAKLEADSNVEVKPILKEETIEAQSQESVI